MKNVLIGFFIACTIFIRVQQIFAQDGMTADKNLEINNVILITPMPQSEKIEYTLPYPGILTNHPLYFLKSLRDSLMEVFLSDPVRKLDYYLLQSDKFLAMAETYATRGKWDETKDTLKRSQFYMEKSVDFASNLLKDGRTVPGHLMGRFEKSTVKHKELADGFITASGEAGNGAFEQSSAVFATLAARVAAMK